MVLKKHEQMALVGSYLNQLTLQDVPTCEVCMNCDNLYHVPHDQVQTSNHYQDNRCKSTNSLLHTFKMILGVRTT